MEERLVHQSTFPKNVPFINGAVKICFSKLVSLVAGKYILVKNKHWVVLYFYLFRISQFNFTGKKIIWFRANETRTEKNCNI